MLWVTCSFYSNFDKISKLETKYSRYWSKESEDPTTGVVYHIISHLMKLSTLIAKKPTPFQFIKTKQISAIGSFRLCGVRRTTRKRSQMTHLTIFVLFLPLIRWTILYEFNVRASLVRFDTVSFPLAPGSLEYSTFIENIYSKPIMMKVNRGYSPSGVRFRQ